MATKKLYDDMPYETTFDAEVLSCEKKDDSTYLLVLDRTLFFPEEGGQTPDTGVLRMTTDHGDKVAYIKDVQIDKEDTITHYSDTAFAPGDKVSGEIEWMHRYTNMQCHTGEHIISGIIHRLYGYDNTGFHLSENIVTMDYNGPIEDSDITEIEWIANEAVINNVPVNCSYPDSDTLKTLSYRSKKDLDGPIRIVEIPGVDICACCAPHVRSTGEVGMIKILSADSYKGGMRLSILCGFRALEDYGDKHSLILSLGQRLSANRDTLEDAVIAKDDEIFSLKGRILTLEELLLKKEAECIPPGEKNPCLFTERLSNITVRNGVNSLTKTHPGYCAVFNGNDTEGYSYIIGSADKDCREMLSHLKTKFDIKGGGSPDMIQGRLLAKGSDIKSVFQAF